MRSDLIKYVNVFFFNEFVVVLLVGLLLLCLKMLTFVVVHWFACFRKAGTDILEFTDLHFVRNTLVLQARRVIIESLLRDFFR